MVTQIMVWFHKSLPFFTEEERKAICDVHMYVLIYSEGRLTRNRRTIFSCVASEQHAGENKTSLRVWENISFVSDSSMFTSREYL